MTQEHDKQEEQKKEQKNRSIKLSSPDDEADLPKDIDPSPEVQAAASKEEEVLLNAIRQIQTPEQARQVVNAVLEAAQGTTEQYVREEEAEATEEMNRLQQAAATLGSEDTAALLLEASKEVAGSSGEVREALERAFKEATNPEQEGRIDPTLEKPLHLLRDELLSHMRPLQALDARLFLAVNHLPHTRVTNNIMTGITRVMNGGWGWVLGLIVASLVDGQRGQRALHNVVPPLWFATMTVEYPVKFYFRRHRPFIDVVQAIAVGRKPGTFSFPSGHSASSFAGAWLVRRHYPHLTPLWYAIAATVGFSRMYLGVHYPGDVMSGAVAGTLIAEVTRRVIEHGNHLSELE